MYVAQANIALFRKPRRDLRLQDGFGESDSVGQWSIPAYLSRDDRRNIALSGAKTSRFSPRIDGPRQSGVAMMDVGSAVSSNKALV